MTIDIRLDVEFFQHHKTVKLERRLGLQGVKSLLQLWMWAAKNRPDGTLHNMSAEDVEIAAAWTGDEGVFYDTLVSLRWLDADDALKLHNWAQRNEWVATSQTRGDQARFSRMASTYPVLYARLVAQGRTAITREEYAALTAEWNAVQNAPDAPAPPNENNDRSTTVNGALTPNPSPKPMPKPFNNDPGPNESNERSTTVNEPSFSESVQMAYRVYRAFPKARLSYPTKLDLEWIVSLSQKIKKDIYNTFKEAHDWAKKQNLMVRDPRAFLTEWVKKLAENT